LFLSIFHVLQCVCLIFHIFQCFSPYSRSYGVHKSFSTLFCFLAIFQIIEYSFLFFHVCQVSSHIPDPTVCTSHFPFFSVSHNIRGPTVCI
jgi:hypothetical protein